MKETDADFVVLGGGLMGSSAAWQLAREGKKVLLLERQELPYQFGSSFGEARISRSLGPKNDVWSYLHRRAVYETERLLNFLNEEHPSSHQIEEIYTTSPVTYILHTEKKEVVKRMLQQQDDTYKCASSPEEGQEKFGLQMAKNQVVIQEYKQHTGTINPKALISKLHLATQMKGGEIRYGQKIRSITRRSEVGGHFEIEIHDSKKKSFEKINAKKVISALGPYTGTILKDISEIPEKWITPKRVFLGFFQIDKARYHSYSLVERDKIASFLPVIDLGPTYHFSMIEKTDTSGIPIIKTGGHFQRQAIHDLEDTWKQELSEEEIGWSKTNVLNYFKFLNIPLQPHELIYQQGYSCVYSLTESEVPLLDFLPLANERQDPNFVIMAGMSGVGAKGSLTYGKMAANLLLGIDESDFMYKKTLQKLSFEGH